MNIRMKSGAAALVVLLALGTTIAGTGTARADWGGHRDRDAQRMHRDHDRAGFRHYSRHSREVVVVRSRAHRHYDRDRYRHYDHDRYRHDDAFRWFALTAATLAIMDRLNQPQVRSVVVSPGAHVVWVPAAPVR